jgi:hypothetical protein
MIIKGASDPSLEELRVVDGRVGNGDVNAQRG